MKQIHMKPTERKAGILRAALELAKRRGFEGFTREAIAEAAGITPALVTHYFGPMPGIRDAVLIEAVELEVLEVIAHGILIRSDHTQSLGPRLRRRVVKYMMEG